MGRKIVLILFFILLIFIISHKNKLDIKETTIHIPYGTDSMWERILKEPGVLEIPGSSRAVILPHHLITAPDLTKFYRKLSNNFQPKNIILVGPNHYEEGEANIQTCNCTYSTINGYLKTNEFILKDILDNNLAAYNNKLFEKEHSIYSHAMFIKRFFPDSKIIPFILKIDTSNKEVDRLVEYINSLDDILIISSVDFSHYISHTAADFHDQFSFNAIKDFDYERIKKAEVDSPASLRFASKWAEQNGFNNVSLVNHTNSQDFFRQQKLDLTTSHLFISFSEGKKEEVPQVNIHFFGDAIFDRNIKNIDSKNILNTIAMEEERFFKGNDYNILNLEGILEGDKSQDKEVVFNFDSNQVLDILQNYSFNYVNLANNHSLDYFVKGYENTVNILNENNISTFGGYNINNNTCKSSFKNNLKIAFCGLNDVGKILLIDESIQILSDISKNHDITILNMHWGDEYNNLPNNRQVDLAHKFIDSGVDLIIGHHPHVIQPLEIYNNKAIFYSLGNFIFDQISPEGVENGLSVGVTLSKDQTILYLLPFHTNNGKPEIFNYEENLIFLDNFIKEKEEYYTNIPGKLIINH